MNMKSFLIAAVLTAVPASVFAQDWTGPYAGLQIGGSDIDVDGAPLTGEGPSYGVFAGYNMQNGALIFGGEVDYDVTEYDIGNGAAEVDSTTRVKGRIGTGVGPGMAYGAAGIVWATSPELGDDNGLFYGLGYEAEVTPNVVAGLELLQHEFSDYNDTGLDVSATTLKVRAAFSF
ncbi:MAG: outer membrane beta-barrel protein [Yoonia sp.]|uniref:outer membrane beta-barrel protein n=1 Tax=Yoonia sp. TaxID=2212373 RepID=UPI003EF39E3C